MVPLIGMACSIEQDEFSLGATYVRAIEQAGGVAVGIPALQDIHQVERVLHRLDGLLIPGGADVDPHLYGEEILPENGSLEPDRDRLEIALARWALQHNMPILGICRGMQVLNVAAGGSLYQDIPSQTSSRLQHRQRAPRWYATHCIHVSAGTKLASIFASDVVRVNTFHHQAVHRLAPGFAVSARASDGIVEAIEAERHPFALGVQWHPEAMVEHDTKQLAIFKAFVAAFSATQKETTGLLVGDNAG